MSDAGSLLWAPLRLAGSTVPALGESKGSGSVGNTESREARWKARDAKLDEFVRGLPSGCNYRIDFNSGLFAWVDAKKTKRATASVKLLFSYDVSKKSFVGGWDNPSVNPKLRSTRVDGIPRRGLDPKRVWDAAQKIADASGCEFVYKAVNGSSWVFLGLSTLKKLSKEEQTQYNDSTGWLQLVTMLLARLRKVILMRNAPPAAIAKAFHDAGRLFVQQARSAYRNNGIAVRMMLLGANLLAEISNELKQWAVDRTKAHDKAHVKSILERLLKYEQAAIMSNK